MLVLFIYVTSLASNEIFKPSIITSVMFMIFVFIGTLFNLLDPILIPQPLLLKAPTYINTELYSTDLCLISTIYNPTTINLTIFIVFYLLLTLVVVVKITDTFFGPLRLSSN